MDCAHLPAMRSSSLLLSKPTCSSGMPVSNGRSHGVPSLEGVVQQFEGKHQPTQRSHVPWFGARRLARDLINENNALRLKIHAIEKHLEALGGLTILQLKQYRSDLE